LLPTTVRLDQIARSADHETALGDRLDQRFDAFWTLERPALTRLLCDVEAQLIDVVVVYKIDRLSRSLTDFAKLVDLL
jgi:DNA invertase Pin-like site-specific DNA recombinase